MPDKEYWQIDSAKLARDILDLTRTAKTEEINEAVEKLWNLKP